MGRRKGVAALGAAVLVLAGCGTPDQAGTSGGAVTVLAKAEGWREGLQEDAGHPYLYLEVAMESDSAQRAWDTNVPSELPDADGEPSEPGVYGSLEAVDLERQAVVVVSSGESGSCPAWVEDLRFETDRIEVNLGSADEEQACTDDFNPYRMVLAVDRDRLPSAGDLPVRRVDVPSENLTDVEGEMVAYPVP